jgi:hypothetical protein
MTELVREIEEKANQLSVEERELLAERLLATVRGGIPHGRQGELRRLRLNGRWRISGGSCDSEAGTRSCGEG